MEGIHGGSETSNVVRVGDGGSDEKTGGGDGGVRVEDVTIFIRSDNNGHDQEWNSTGGRKHERQDWGGMNIDCMVYMYGGKMMGILIGRKILRMELSARKEETGKAKKEVYGCGESCANKKN